MLLRIGSPGTTFPEVESGAGTMLSCEADPFFVIVLFVVIIKLFVGPPLAVALIRGSIRLTEVEPG